MKEIRSSFSDFLFIHLTNILSVPVLMAIDSIQARVLGPADYGRVGLIVTTIISLHLVGLNWLRTAIVRFGKEEFVRDGTIGRMTGSFLVSGGLALALTGSLFFTFRHEAMLFMEIMFADAAPLILTGLVLAFLRQFVVEALTVIRLIKYQSFLQRLAGKLTLLTGVLLMLTGYLPFGVRELAILYLVSESMIVVLGLIPLWKSMFPLVWDRGLIREMTLFALPLLVVNWSNTIVNQVDTYVIKYYRPMNDVGYYWASYKIFNTLRSFLLGGLTTVLTPIVIIFRTRGEDGLINSRYIGRLIPQTLFWGLMIPGAMLLLATPMFLLVYGEPFRPSIRPFLILFSSVNFSIALAVIYPLITAFNYNRWLMISGIFVGLFNLTGDILLVPLLGIEGASLTSWFVFSANGAFWILYIFNKHKTTGSWCIIFPLLLSVEGAVLSVGLPLWAGAGGGLLVLLAGFLFALRLGVYRASDRKILADIGMPSYIRKSLERLIVWMDRPSGKGDEA